MAGIRSIHRGPLAKGFASGSSAPIRVDDSLNVLKYIPAGSGTTEVAIVDVSTAQALSGKTLAAADGIVKFQPVTGTKVWISGAAYSAFTTTQATLVGSAGIVFWAVTAINATDMQVDMFHTTYSAVNKAGTTTGAHTYVSAEEAKSVSTGTLTFTAAMVDSGAGLATFTVTPTSSITPTTLVLSFTVFPLVGAVTIL